MCREHGQSLTILARILLRSASVLAHDPAQLASQMLGRLSESDDAAARKLCTTARPHGADVWLRPATASLKDSSRSDLFSLPATHHTGHLAFSQHLGRTYLAIFDRAGAALWDLDRGARTSDVPPSAVQEAADLTCLASGHVGGSLLVLTVSEDRSLLKAWPPGSAIPAWEWRPPVDPDDTYAPIEAAALTDDLEPPLAAVAVWHRGEGIPRVWLLDPVTGGERRTIDIGRSRTETLAVAGKPDQTFLAASLFDTVGVWDCATGEKIQSLPNGEMAFGKAPLALGSAGDRLCVASSAKIASRKKGVAVWDAVTVERLAFFPLDESSDDVTDLVFAEGVSGALLVVGLAGGVSKKGAVQICDVDSQTVLRTVPVATERVVGAAVRDTSSPLLLATGTDDSVRVWDLDLLLDEEIEGSAHQSEVTAIACGPSAASGDREGVVQVWSADGRPAHRVELGESVSGLAWCVVRGVDALAVATERRIIVLDPASGVQIRRIKLRGTVVEGRLAAAGADERWYLAVETSRLVMPDQLDPFDPDYELGQPVNVSSVQVFEAGGGSALYELSHQGWPLAWQLDRVPMFVVRGRYGDCSFVDAASGRSSETSGTRDTAACAAVHPAVLQHALERIGVQICSIPAELAAPVGAPASGWIASSVGRELQIWDAAAQRSLGAFTADDHITCFAVSSTGRTLTAGDRSGAVHHLHLEDSG